MLPSRALAPGPGSARQSAPAGPRAGRTGRRRRAATSTRWSAPRALAPDRGRVDLEPHGRGDLDQVERSPGSGAGSWERAAVGAGRASGGSNWKPKAPGFGSAQRCCSGQHQGGSYPRLSDLGGFPRRASPQMPLVLLLQKVSNVENAIAPNNVGSLACSFSKISALFIPK